MHRNGPLVVMVPFAAESAFRFRENSIAVVAEAGELVLNGIEMSSTACVVWIVPLLSACKPCNTSPDAVTRCPAASSDMDPSRV